MNPAEEANKIVNDVMIMKRMEGFNIFVSVMEDIDEEDYPAVTEAILGEMFFDN